MSNITHPDIDHVESAYDYLEDLHGRIDDMNPRERESLFVQALTHLQAELGRGGFNGMSDEDWEEIGMEPPWVDPHEEDTCINCGRQPDPNPDVIYHPIPTENDRDMICSLCIDQLRERGERP